jgi:replication-associated recombination protein RarA
MNLSEKYRPTTLDGVVGQEKAVALIRRLQERNGLGGKSFLLSSEPGRGKTTLAQIMASMVADKLYTRELPGSVLSAKEVWDWYLQSQNGTLFGGGHALIVNELHTRERKDTIDVFLHVLENLSPTAIVIFTTTNDGLDLFRHNKLDAAPFLSRCIQIKLSDRDLCKPFAELARRIAQAEGLDGCAPKEYETLAKECRNNMREILNKIESGYMLTKAETN